MQGPSVEDLVLVTIAYTLITYCGCAYSKLIDVTAALTTFRLTMYPNLHDGLILTAPVKFPVRLPPRFPNIVTTATYNNDERVQRFRVNA